MCESLVIATKTVQPHKPGYCLIDVNSLPTCLCKHHPSESCKDRCEKCGGNSSSSFLSTENSCQRRDSATCTFIAFTIRQFVKVTHTHLGGNAQMSQCTLFQLQDVIQSVSFTCFHVHTHFPSAKTRFFFFQNRIELDVFRDWQWKQSLQNSKANLTVMNVPFFMNPWSREWKVGLSHSKGFHVAQLPPTPTPAT